MLGMFAAFPSHCTHSLSGAGEIKNFAAYKYLLHRYPWGPIDGAGSVCYRMRIVRKKSLLQLFTSAT